MRNKNRIFWSFVLLFCGYESIAFCADPTATPVKSIRVQSGFQVELVRSAGKNENSWISMTFDNKGRLIVGLDDKGLARLTLHADPAKTKFERIENKLVHCRGVLYAHDSLYVSATNSKGFYRLKDTTGDDQFDQVQLLTKLDYRSRFGHGHNQIVLGPDNMIYLVVGNDVAFPEGTSPTSAYRNPHHDLLLPNPHDGDPDDRVGYILRTDAQGKKWDIVAGGFRNQVDMAFDSEGEMFTYDADMEWDVGQPWYRPTRINHIVSGGEYGWRWGTGKWPVYYQDSLPSTLDLGLGSPTGMLFGTESNFPARFKKAMYIADWQNGRILLVDLIPQGASYGAQYEVFLEGGPLNVCDMQFGPDGALYFITGGRGSQSGLYRVSPTTKQNSKSTAPVINSQVEKQSLDARKQRREIERYHVQKTGDIKSLWKHLHSEDRWLRFAARTAIENQDVARWRNLALQETETTAGLAGLIALCRQGESADRDAVIKALNRIVLENLKQDQRLGLLRAYQLCFIRLGRPNLEQASLISQRLSQIYPHATNSANHLLCEILVYLNNETVVEKTVELLNKNSTQEEQIRAARTLIYAKQGWDKKTQRGFLTWLTHARKFGGGKQTAERVQDIQNDFLNTLSEQQQLEFSNSIASLKKPLIEEETVQQRPVIQQWTVSDLVPHLKAATSGRSYQNGRQALLAANCLKCHRIGSSGAQIGPDLTQVGKRFDALAILESIITPSKIMDPKYLHTVYILKSGKLVTGRTVGVNGTSITVEVDAIKQTSVPIARDEIEESLLSKTSPMPAHLIDVLTREEILDLIALLRSGGNPEDAAFKRQNKK
ncbi:MAG: c-type cytochrome [Planctomycetaceae bacterium]|nr:c-type cytochrome [Planctomycetaceae bacterium]